jgi:hypothetical protein
MLLLLLLCLFVCLPEPSHAVLYKYVCMYVCKRVGLADACMHACMSVSRIQACMQAAKKCLLVVLIKERTNEEQRTWVPVGGSALVLHSEQPAPRVACCGEESVLLTTTFITLGGWRKS